MTDNSLLVRWKEELGEYVPDDWGGGRIFKSSGEYEVYRGRVVGFVATGAGTYAIVSDGKRLHEVAIAELEVVS